VNDPSLVPHEGGMLPVKAGGIVPRPEVLLLLFLSSVVSVNSNVNGQDALFLSLCFVLESASVLEANGEGVAGICGGGEGDLRTSWIDASSGRRRVDNSLPGGYLLTDHDS
jgi:hypothetical protein